MSGSLKDKPDLAGDALQEALLRLAENAPDDVRKIIEQIRNDEEKAKQYVEERRESIHKGARRAPKSFRL